MNTHLNTHLLAALVFNFLWWALIAFIVWRILT